LIGIPSTSTNATEIIVDLKDPDMAGTTFNATTKQNVDKLVATKIGNTVTIGGVITLTNAIEKQTGSTYSVISGLPLPVPTPTNTIAGATLAEILNDSVDSIPANIGVDVKNEAYSPVIVPGVVSVSNGGILQLSIPKRAISKVEGGSIIINQFSYITI
jgi:hypothetical protein